MSLTIPHRHAENAAVEDTDSPSSAAPDCAATRRGAAVRRPWGMRLAEHHPADTTTAPAMTGGPQARFDPLRQIGVTGDGTPVAHTDSRLMQVTTKLPGDPHDWQDPSRSARLLHQTITLTAVTAASTAARPGAAQTVGTVSRPWGMRLCTPPANDVPLAGVRYDSALQVSLTATGVPAAGTEIMNLITSLSGGTTGGDDVAHEDTPPSYPPDEAHPAPATLLGATSSTGGAEGAVFDPHRQVTVGADGTPLARTGALADRTSKYLKGADDDQPDDHEPGPLEVPIAISATGPTVGSAAVEVLGGAR